MPSAFVTTGAASVVGLESAGTMALETSALGGGLSDVLAWVAIGAFLLALGLQWRGDLTLARWTGTAAWVLFGVFWLTLVSHYYHEVQSPIQTFLSVAALPLCVYTGYLLFNGRSSLFVLTKAVALMGIIYLPVETIPVVKTWLIETTAAQTHFGMELFGYSPGLVEGRNGYVSKFDFDPNETVTGRTTYIILACTGIGSMAIFGGLVASVTAPLKRKLTAFSIAVGVIWFLNLARNVFIGLASPWGWFQQDWLVSFMTTYMGAQPDKVSYLVAHNYIAQTLSIVALVGITYLVVKIVPEVLAPLEEVLYIAEAVMVAALVHIPNRLIEIVPDALVPLEAVPYNITAQEYDLFEALDKEEYRPAAYASEFDSGLEADAPPESEADPVPPND